MTHQPPILSPASLPLRLSSERKSFAYSIESLQACCVEAGEAARSGRYSIAHDLFQNALVFFDRAHHANWDVCEDLYLWQRTWQLSRARTQLDECAALIYTEEVAQQSRAWPAIVQEEGQ